MQRAAPESAGPAAPELLEDLVAANRILTEYGVLDGFGHVSVRHDRNSNRYLMSRSRAPELVVADDIVEYDLDSEPVEQRRRVMYRERYIHGEIYKVRPDVQAVVHNHSPALIPFGITPAPLRPVYHMGYFLAGGVPVFEIRDAGGMTDMLVSNPALGEALARTLGNRPVALMRGHGAVVVGASLRIAVFRSIYTEMNARLQVQAMALGPVTYLGAEEARMAEGTIGSSLERPWELWKRRIQQNRGASN